MEKSYIDKDGKPVKAGDPKAAFVVSPKDRKKYEDKQKGGGATKQKGGGSGLTIEKGGDKE